MDDKLSIESTDVNEKEESVLESEIRTENYVGGQKIKLESANLYSESSSRRRSSVETGIFYLWSSEVVNNRIRVTTSPDKAGIDDQIVGWVSTSSVITEKTLTPPKEVDCPETSSQEGLESAVSEADSTVVHRGSTVKFNSRASRWATGQGIPSWVKLRTLYVRSEPSDGVCQVSTRTSGPVTGVAYVKDLHKF